MGAESVKRCILLAGGPADDWDGAPLERLPGDFVVACDAGYESAVRLGWRPDLAVGDFDTYHGSLDDAVRVYKAPPEKDDTDLMLGIKLALREGCRDFCIYGAFGGRLDHTIGNLQALAYLCNHGARGEIRALRNRAWAVRDGSLSLPRMDGWHLSVFAWDGLCEGVCLRGLAYPLTEALLSPDFPLGVSNEFAGEQAHISVRHGMLLVVASLE